MTNLDSILKSRDITLLTNVDIVKAMVFPEVMYGYESWTIKKAEHQRIDILKLWCWKRLLRVPWTARRSNKSVLKEINPEYSLEGLMLKLKPQYFGHLMWRADSLEKTLMLEIIEGRRRKGWQRMEWLDSVTDKMDMNLSKLQEIVNRGHRHATINGVVKSWTQLESEHKNGYQYILKYFLHIILCFLLTIHTICPIFFLCFHMDWQTFYAIFIADFCNLSHFSHL